MSEATKPHDAPAAHPSVTVSHDTVTLPADLVADFRRVYARYRDWNNKNEIESEVFERRMAEEGWPSKMRLQLIPQSPQFFEVQKVIDRVYNEIDPDPDRDKNGDVIDYLDEIQDELHPIISEILDHPAQTLADLVIIAQAIVAFNSHFWSGSIDDDEEARQRLLVDKRVRRRRG